MRLINADLLKAKAYPGYHTPGEVDPLVVELSDIDDAPTIFAIPAPVKCGECKYHMSIPKFCDIKGGQWQDDEFCSEGERKDEFENEKML